MQNNGKPLEREALEEALIVKLFDDLFAAPYRPAGTDIDACGNHEKHTPQCYACRHAKWSNVIKAELRDRLDVLVAMHELADFVAEREKAARLDEWEWIRQKMPYTDQGALFEARAAKRIKELEGRSNA